MKGDGGVEDSQKQEDGEEEGEGRRRFLLKLGMGIIYCLG